MAPFRKILVPTDFSKHSTEAVNAAADLSRRYEAPVTLAYVFEPVTYALPEGHVMQSPPQLEEMRSVFEQRLVQATAEARAAGALDVQAKLLTGPVANEITDFAEQGRFDLIVMGTHGRTGLRHLVLGSVAETVVRTAPCAVLTVRVRESVHD
ncbi:MAG TPA: universal stress protein [Polyangiaceae bacterium]|nr:universal stress protein [Polyangiaceae bacterium]